MPDGNNLVRHDEPAPLPMPVSPFSPRSLEAAMALAEFLCRARTIPEFLRDNPADMLLVIEQAARWRMSPFWVAQCAYSVRGKLGFEGKLIHAAIENWPLITGYIDYRFAGEGEKRMITVSATRRGETEPRAITVRLVDARTNNEQWVKQPDQQLCYHAVRVWARRWAASALAGAYAPEEFDDAPQVLDGVAAEPVQLASDPRVEPGEVSAESTPISSLRDAINAEVLLAPKRMTVRLWLEQLADRLATCDSRDEVEAALLSEEVLRATRTLKPSGRQALREIAAEALARHPEPESA